MFKDMDYGVKTVGFGWKAFKKFPEIIPLVTIMGVATVGVSAFSLYSLFCKTDVQINRDELARWQTIDVNKPQKFLTINQTYGEDPAITALKKEINEAYRRQ
ncbi:normal mucosa of esophagus-specific gene 1 protein-like [Palaemon carinicauda]|uniref:normal mucosa of esophagus-specific gene 1 protein-like n=1 Tax=Palaemon carinicauda TaxID=392227 RepID=UPI0035B661D7